MSRSQRSKDSGSSSGFGWGVAGVVVGAIGGLIGAAVYNSMTKDKQREGSHGQNTAPPNQPPPVSSVSSTTEFKTEPSKDVDVECTVCYDKEVSAAFIPCGHMCCCVECANETQRIKGTCPICRTPIRNVQKIYNSCK